MLKMHRFYDKIAKKGTVGIDIMNRNSIVSLAMLYALWQSNHKDLLALIRPFIMYAVGQTTKIDSAIDVSTVCTYMETEFGYRSFQPAVVVSVLKRETSFEIKKEDRFVEKRDKNFFLVRLLTPHNDTFREKRTHCKTKSDAVTNALAKFLNEKRACKRNNYTQQEAEQHLMAFFREQGSSILLSVDDLRQINCRKNEVYYFVAKFILEENEKKSFLMDYIVELVKGYFVTSALYLQAENPNITTAAFRDITFFLDTRLLLAFLGYKSKQENDSVKEMVNSLLRSGAKVACFEYNIDEVNNILEAYKQSKVNEAKRPSPITLEFFDENGYSYCHVDAAQKMFQSRLEHAGITPTSTNSALEVYGVADKAAGLLNDDRIKDIILHIKPRYNTIALPDDLLAINTVSRIRQGKRLAYIERSKAVFVTSNTVLVAAVKQCLTECNLDYGFPLAITDEDLCVIAWLKDFEQSNSLPQMRLLENVMAAISPSTELMDAYFSHLEHLEKQGDIGADEAALLRVDLFARTELMELTYGEKSNVNTPVIETIREKLRKESRDAGIEQGKQDALKAQQRALSEQRNAVCKRAEDEVNTEYQKKEKAVIGLIRAVAFLVAALLLFATVWTFVVQARTEWKVLAIVATAIPMIQSIMPFLGKDTWPIRKAKELLAERKKDAIDTRRRHYLGILENSVK